MSTPKQFTKAYGANDIGSLQTLDLTVESDEANLRAKVINLQLARNENGADVTAVTYESASQINFGHLTLVQYVTDVDEQSEMAIHQSQGETFQCKGEAFIGGQAVKILVFREKAQ